MERALCLTPAPIPNNQKLLGPGRRQTLRSARWTPWHKLSAQQSSPASSASSRDQTGAFESVTGYKEPIQASGAGDASSPGLPCTRRNGGDSSRSCERAGGEGRVFGDYQHWVNPPCRKAVYLLRRKDSKANRRAPGIQHQTFVLDRFQKLTMAKWSPFIVLKINFQTLTLSDWKEQW